jgi:hypothetical protein
MQRQAKTQKDTSSTMVTITSSSNYWTATAQHVMPALAVKQPHEYAYDDCGIKCRINPDDETDWQPCEPHCANCGYPPGVCDPYVTRCDGTKLGSWFNEEQGEWMETEHSRAKQQQEEEDKKREEDERWNQHKYGLCPICNVGLDDKSEFTLNYANGSQGAFMCWDCDAKLS